MPCFLLKFSLCFSKGRRAGALAEFGSRNRDLAKPGQPAFSHKNNENFMRKQDMCRLSSVKRASPANRARSFSLAYLFPHAGDTMPDHGSHSSDSCCIFFLLLN